MRVLAGQKWMDEYWLTGNLSYFMLGHCYMDCSLTQCQQKPDAIAQQETQGFVIRIRWSTCCIQIVLPGNSPIAIVLFQKYKQRRPEVQEITCFLVDLNDYNKPWQKYLSPSWSSWTRPTMQESVQCSLHNDVLPDVGWCWVARTLYKFDQV